MRTLTAPLLLGLVVLAGCNDIPEGTGVAITPEAPSTLDDLTVDITAEAEDRHPVTYRYD